MSVSFIFVTNLWKEYSVNIQRRFGLREHQLNLQVKRKLWLDETAINDQLNLNLIRGSGYKISWIDEVMLFAFYLKSLSLAQAM